MNNTQIEVPTYVIMDIEKVRLGGKCNMFDSQSVLYELNKLECYRSVCWLMNENWHEGSYHSQTDLKKYAAALNALSETKELADILSVQ